jgi:hypothetical protein
MSAPQKPGCEQVVELFARQLAPKRGKIRWLVDGWNGAVGYWISPATGLAICFEWNGMLGRWEVETDIPRDAAECSMNRLLIEGWKEVES